MDCNFKSVFQSYQDDERVIMKCYVKQTPFMVEQISASRELKMGPLCRQAETLPTLPFVVVDVLLFYIHGKQLWSYWEGQVA